MTVAGLNASEILNFMRLRLRNIQDVQSVERGFPTVETLGKIGLPAIFIYYGGSIWGTKATQHYNRDATINLALIVTGAGYEDAEDRMFLLQDRVKAWLTANQEMQTEAGNRYAYRALVLSDSPIEPVDSPERLRCDMSISVHWLERFTSEVNSASRGVVGAGS